MALIPLFAFLNRGLRIFRNFPTRSPLQRGEYKITNYIPSSPARRVNAWNHDWKCLLLILPNIVAAANVFDVTITRILVNLFTNIREIATLTLVNSFILSSFFDHYFSHSTKKNTLAKSMVPVVTFY